MRNVCDLPLRRLICWVTCPSGMSPPPGTLVGDADRATVRLPVAGTLPELLNFTVTVFEPTPSGPLSTWISSPRRSMNGARISTDWVLNAMLLLVSASRTDAADEQVVAV